MTYVVGLTGIIGSGKSLVASIFEEFGVRCIDTDLISHQITTNNGLAIAQIRSAFGSEYIDKNANLDRKKMRELVFNDPQKRLLLEQILHPIIFDEVIKLIKDINTIYVILVIPLLFKSDQYRQMLARILFVDCPEDILIKRVQQRSQLSVEQIKSIIGAQVSRKQQIIMSDDIIDNSSDVLSLVTQVNQLHAKYMQLFK